jgi:fructose-1-phosphate kinase PfkB-like protein
MLGLRCVKPRFQVVDELEETGKMQTTRRCIEITLGDSGASLNFSPRIVWSQRAAEAVLSRASEVALGADLVVMAGAPPVWDVSEDAHLTTRNFYARIIDALGPECQVSIDTRGQYLYDCLVGQKKPRFILMNTDEFDELLGLLTDLDERVFSGTLIVHDEHGSWVWDNELPCGHDPFPDARHLPSVPVRRVYSTIGAGDAMHAGFLKEWICAESGAHGNASQDERLHRAVVYSQVVAAVSVSNSKATHGIDAHIVEARFRRIWQGGRSSC